MIRLVFTAAGLATLATTRTSLASQNTRIASVSRLPNTIENFWIEDDGAVDDAYEYNGGAWTTFQLAPPGTASGGSRITAVSRSSNTMELFFIGADGSIQHWYWYDGSQWYSAPLATAGSASLNGGITAVSRASNTMEVWYVAPNGSVQGLDFYDNTGWQSYQLAPAGSASTISAIAAVSRSPTMLEVWYGGPDGSIQGRVNKFDGYDWQPYTLAPAGSSSLTPPANGAPLSPGVGAGLAAVSRASNTQEVFFIGGDGSLQHWYYYDGSPWYSAPLAGAGSASLASSIAAVSRGSNTMEIWYEGADQSVQDRYWLDGIGWQGFQFAAPYASPWITAVSREQDAMEVLYLGPGDSLVDTGFTDATGWGLVPVGIPIPLQTKTFTSPYFNAQEENASATLTLSSDGSFEYKGNVHDYGGGADFFAFDAFPTILPPGTHGPLFDVEGRVYGTFESGSRDSNFDVKGLNSEITTNWETIAMHGVSFRLHLASNVGSDLLNVLKDVGIAIVVAVPAYACTNCTVSASTYQDNNGGAGAQVNCTCQ